MVADKINYVKKYICFVNEVAYRLYGKYGKFDHIQS